MGNKPQNVGRHRHYDVYTCEEIGDDLEKDIVRYDACVCEGDQSIEYGVWDVDKDVWYPTLSYDEACELAQKMATTRRLDLGMEPLY